MPSPVKTEAPMDDLGSVKYVFGRVTLFYELSVLRCLTATDFFTKTSPKRLATREKQSLSFWERIVF